MNRSNDNNDGLQKDLFFDRRLRESLHAKMVPVQLKTKLLDRIRQEAQSDSQVSPLAANAATNRFDAVTSSAELDALRADTRPEGDLPQASDSPAPAGADSRYHANPSSQPRTSSWQWLSRAAALAACLAVLAFGLSWFGGAPDYRQLANHCRTELEILQSRDSWQLASPSPELEELIQHHLSLSKPRIIGESQCMAGKFGSEARAWKIADRRGEVCVFVFHDPPTISGLGSQLRVIQDSGAWNLAARRGSSSLIVVASTTDVRVFFKRSTFA